MSDSLRPLHKTLEEWTNQFGEIHLNREQADMIKKYVLRTEHILYEMLCLLPDLKAFTEKCEQSAKEGEIK